MAKTATKRTKAATPSKTTVRNRIKDIADALGESYNRGYQDGYAAAEKIPNVRGARAAATAGYGKGIKDNRKVKRIRKKAGVGK